ncbi:outer membrane protein assembly factor [Flammeovirga yaeyamensis]|uniref:Outer membrane protein assembly factor n=1 Tax=Flammeovirga yaeyamensis TaxID=367791 RepID=A0AAX1N5A0_9BACT|nr:BamA/TamA family outer membrane protein [Flammeovirga yaeyamensis]MBB3701485.1 hypothetical protein [Flammeovirga yaeyamensis]NMF38608.1 BamA/TamA family outer membrane protein [Flammeovirga yaeyamensis]QWG02729.1 outer membrane protein assembly factor [Flammeovirga yaeyamensis]
MNINYKKLLLFITLILSTQILYAQSKFNDYFIDSADHCVDVSGFLNAGFGFLPVPILITEPAVGLGGGLVGVFFHGQQKERVVVDSTAHFENNKNLPPVMTAVAGAYTENGTWLTMIAHQGSYLNDRLRYTGAVGYISPNLTFYGGNVLDAGEYEFNMKGFVTFHELLFRPVAKVPMFAGFNYVYFNNDVSFDTKTPELGKLEEENNLGGLNLVGMWDSRNSTFTPTKGIMSATEFGVFDKALGGDNDYWNFSHRTYFYQPIIKEKLFSGYRLNYAAKWGDSVPFYELPFINLRGIQALRYQDHNALTLETEWRWQFTKRWSAVGFAGAGFTAPKIDQFDFSKGQYAVGGGFRYFIAKEYGLHAGIDIARGPEVWAWYLTVGSNWFR